MESGALVGTTVENDFVTREHTKGKIKHGRVGATRWARLISDTIEDPSGLRVEPGIVVDFTRVI